jgi:hypothetical protein
LPVDASKMRIVWSSPAAPMSRPFADSDAAL